MRSTDHAEAAAEAIRALNHSTLPHSSAEGYEWPSDVDEAAGQLAALAHRLPQALDQAAAWLERESGAGRIGHDQGLDGEEEARTAALLLRFSGARADALARDLDAVRAITAHLTGIRPPESAACCPRREGGELS